MTVVAENAAGLRTVIYSDPLTIDLTPPHLCCISVSRPCDLSFLLYVSMQCISKHRGTVVRADSQSLT